MSGNSRSNNGDNSSHNINGRTGANTMKSQNKEFGRIIMTVREVKLTVHFDRPVRYYSERILQLQYYPWESSVEWKVEKRSNELKVGDWFRGLIGFFASKQISSVRIQQGFLEYVNGCRFCQGINTVTQLTLVVISTTILVNIDPSSFENCCNQGTDKLEQLRTSYMIIAINRNKL